MNNISASIVLFNTNLIALQKAIDSLFLFKSELTLYLIDNSYNDNLKFFESQKILYVYNPSNPGFGAAHNIAIKKAIAAGCKYHFIVNPDIYFDENVITPMVDFMKNDLTIGMMMPQILNEDGSVQNLPKLLKRSPSILIKPPQVPSCKFRGMMFLFCFRL